MKWYIVGRTDNKVIPGTNVITCRFTSMKLAETFLERTKEKDEEGVLKGEYYIEEVVGGRMSGSEELNPQSILK